MTQPMSIWGNPDEFKKFLSRKSKELNIFYLIVFNNQNTHDQEIYFKEVEKVAGKLKETTPSTWNFWLAEKAFPGKWNWSGGITDIDCNTSIILFFKSKKDRDTVNTFLSLKNLGKFREVVE